MTHAELYEIVKDHRDVWGRDLRHCDQYFASVFPRDVSLETTPAVAKHALIGLGVAWLVENGGSARIYPPLPMRREYFVGTDDCGGWRLPSLLASVYAAIAEAKKGGQASEP